MKCTERYRQRIMIMCMLCICVFTRIYTFSCYVACCPGFVPFSFNLEFFYLPVRSSSCRLLFNSLCILLEKRYPCRAEGFLFLLQGSHAGRHWRKKIHAMFIMYSLTWLLDYGLLCCNVMDTFFELCICMLIHPLNYG